jgi:hypothetical protein
MSELGDRVRLLKEQAQFHKKAAVRARDRGDEAQSRHEFDQAEHAIHEAIEEIGGSEQADSSAVDHIDRTARDRAFEIADCWGILGGIYREWRRIDDAIAAYDAGYAYEKKPEYDINSTYNTINRLALRILANPSLLNTSGSTPVDSRLEQPIPQLLAEAGQSIETKWRFMTDPVWALADMVLIQTLLQTPNPAKWEDLLKEKAINRFPFDSLAAMVRILAQAGLPTSRNLDALAARLEQFVESKWPSPGAVSAV